VFRKRVNICSGRTMIPRSESDSRSALQPRRPCVYQTNLPSDGHITYEV